MSWAGIDIRFSLWEDDRVEVAAQRCGVHKAQVVGALVYLWIRAKRDGKMQRGHALIAGLTPERFEEKVGVPGLVKALDQESGTDWIRVAPCGSLLMPRAVERFHASQKEIVAEYERRRKRDYRRAKGLDSRGKHADDVPDKGRTVPGRSRTVPVSVSVSDQTVTSPDSDLTEGERFAAGPTPDRKSAVGVLPALPDEELASARRRGFMSARGIGSPMELLMRRGVEEPSLSLIAEHPELTRQMIESADGKVKAARPANSAAYFVSVLRKRLGIGGDER